MRKFLRIALTWLLAAALPLQGYAAQAMLMCGPAHHQSAVAHDHALHDHSDALEGLADAVPLYGDATGSAAALLDHHVQTLKSGHVSKCSACLSCCSATAITISVLAAAVIPQHLPVVATIPAGNAVETVGGLDRPPRPFLA